jgi:hypothetical protein
MSTHARMPITFSLNDRTPITISQYFKTHHIIIIRSINWAAHLRNFCFYSLANPHVIYSEFFLSFFPQQEPSREFLRILFFPLKFLLACCSMQHTHAGASQVPSSQLPSARAHMQGQVGPTGRPPIVALFAWLISHQPAVLFSQNKPATSNEPAVLFSQNKPAPAISYQPTEQATCLHVRRLGRLGAAETTLKHTRPAVENSQC